MELKSLLQRIDELKQEKTSLLDRIAGIDPKEFYSLETNVKSLCMNVKEGLS
jgi:hypothetical protein